MTSFKSKAIEKANVIGFLVVLAIAGAASLFTFDDTIDKNLRNIRYETSERPLSDNIVFIAMDEKSIKEIGTYPWRRSVHGELINQLQESGAKKLGFDIGFIGEGSYPQDNKILEDSIKGSGFPVGIAVPGNDEGIETKANEVKGLWPLERFTNAGADVYSIWVEMNKDGQFEKANPIVMVDGKPMPSFAAWIADNVDAREPYHVNWQYNAEKIETYSYVDVLRGKVDKSAFNGKRIIVGPDASIFQDRAIAATGVYMSGARAQVISAETLMHGINGKMSENLILLVTILFCGLILMTKNIARKYGYILIGGTALVVLQWHNEANLGMETSVGSSLMVVGSTFTVAIAVQMIGYFFGRVTHHEGTKIPNAIAMRMSPARSGAIVAITINNNLDILSQIGPEGRNGVMVKVAKVIECGTNGRQIFQIDDSTFAWKADPALADENWQIDSIMALLRCGVVYNGQTVDILASGGIEVDETITNEDAVNNAMVAASRAQARGINWEKFEKSDSDEKWKISVVSEISKAIENGQIWVAYQPKVDAITNEVQGAEALVRWTHPEKGNIRPDAFIPLLEKASRTDDLTHFMFHQVMKDFSTLQRGNVAVNVSPTMIGNGSLVKMIKDALKEHKYEPGRLTIEVTESEKFSSQEAIEELNQIKKMGVKISIDDYGMGNSTVNYLRIIPANELKIDRSFIANMLANKSDRMVVASTIHLAHEMGMKVVAEGVETQEIQEYLSELKCDFIQGYHTGKPVAFSDYAEASRLSDRLLNGKAA